MQELYDWLDEKLTHSKDTIFEPKSITHEFKKVGGLYPYAGLSIDLQRADSFKLEIISSVEDEKWHDAIKNALFGFLMNRSFAPLLNIDIKVHPIKSHEMRSSYAAFHAATKQALEIAFGLKK